MDVLLVVADAITRAATEYLMIKSILAQLALASILVVGWANAAEQPDVVCVEAAPVWVCESRPLESAGRIGETVRVCEMVRSVVCE